jgi:hypothetical protein
MSVTRLTCPSCTTTLKLAAAVAPGKKVKCPKCANVFVVPAAEADTEVQPPPARPSAPPAKTAPKPRAAVPPEPPRRAKAPAPPSDDLDDDDFESLAAPRKPAKAAPRSDEDDDAGAPDDEELMPKKAAKKGKKKASPMMFWGVIGGGVALVAIAFLAFMYIMGVGPFAPGDVRAPITRKQHVADTTPYTLKIKHYPDVGKKVNVTSTLDNTMVIKDYDADGEVKKEKTQKTVREHEYTLTVVDVEGGRPKKFEHNYKKAVVKTGDKEAPSPYQGRTIVFELEDGAYKASAAGAPPLAPAQLAELVADANKYLEGDPEKIFLPKSAVKIDEKWPIDAKALATMFGKGVFDDSASKGEGRLDNVTEKDGKKVGQIEIDIKLVFSKSPAPKGDPPTMDTKINLTTVIDGSSPTWNMQVNGTMVFATTRKDGSKSESTTTTNFTVAQSAAGE